MERKWEVFVPEKFQEKLSRFGRGHFKEQMAHAIEFGYRQWKEKF